MPLAGNAIELDALQQSARRIFQIVAPELALVEAEFERQVASNVQVIAYLGEYLREAGGKRVRPALTLLATYAVGGDAAQPNAVRMATVMEFIHTATLVHDDIIDNAETRRNRPSVNARFGNPTAVLMGDWLYMSAFENSLEERSLAILDILTRVTRKMTEGELIQLTMLGRTDLDEAEYFDVLERKTAYLFSACCEVGALIGGGDEAQQVALRNYGMQLGTAFQLIDDILDCTADHLTLGKAAGADLLEGKLTLPLIYALQSNPSLHSMVMTIMRDGSYEKFPRAELLHEVERTGALEKAQLRAQSHADAARSALRQLPPGVYTATLEQMAAYILEREN